MSEQDMSLERFRTLLEAYGGRLERWPEAQRACARTLLETSEEARFLAAGELELDDALNELPATALSSELERRLNEIPVLHAAGPRKWPFASIWAPALGWALAAAVGLVVGAYSGELEEEGANTPSDESELVSLATGAFSELEEP